MGLSIWHILVVLLVVLVVFGAGKLPNVMGDLGRGIRSFKSGLSGDNRSDDKDDDAKMSGQAQPKLPPSDDKKNGS